MCYGKETSYSSRRAAPDKTLPSGPIVRTALQANHYLIIGLEAAPC